MHDVVVVGAGVAGLVAARARDAAGIVTTLSDASARSAAGATSPAAFRTRPGVVVAARVTVAASGRAGIVGRGATAPRNAQS